MALLSLRNVELAFGSRPLLDGVTLHLEEGERVALLGRNGAGKSSLLSVVAGGLAPDAGEIDRRQGLSFGVLVQEVPAASAGSVREVVAVGAHAAHDELDAARRVDEVLSRLDLQADVPFGTLSAGVKRRVMLGRALAAEPDVLLLDEPTNHLDIDAITWLEDFLARFAGTLLFVTHDRAFMQRLATRIIELDRGRLVSFPGSYQRFVERRDELYAAEERAAAEFDKKLAVEEAWIRGGIKARGVRNMGRVRALERLRNERSARRSRMGAARMNVQEAQRSGKLVVEATGVSLAYGDKPVLRDLSTLILRGDRVGVLGPNGCGKTTLLRTLLGELQPATGEVRLGTRLSIAYFDQLRDQLDPAQSVSDSVGDGREHVELGGQPRHVIGYLEDWLFPAERAQSPVSSLSGGERNRLLLARLFLKPSNVLVLDEPTNDLDIETLELLEQRLLDYGGTVLVVSHDRSFLDNVVTSTLAYEGEGRFVDYAGGYSDWLLQRAGGPQPAADAEPEPEVRQPKAAKPKTPNPRKLSFKERGELDALPARIEALEAEQAELHDKLADPSFYQREGDAVASVKARLDALEAELEQAYHRWQDLEAIADASA